LMVLAEALLRVPDAATADRLIEDKLATGDWSGQDIKSNAFLVSASAWTLGITARIIQPGETPDTILETLIKRLGLPAVRTATRQAMRLLGSHFVLGQTIEEALDQAADHQDSRYSFDMLGEGARTARGARSERRSCRPSRRPMRRLTRTLRPRCFRRRRAKAGRKRVSMPARRASSRRSGQNPAALAASRTSCASIRFRPARASP